MSVYILPIIFILLFVYCLVKKINTYDTFVQGAKGAIKLVVSIFPYIATIMIAPILIATIRIATIMLILR